jgi:hypothetical protein
VLTLGSNSREAAAERLDVARGAEEVAANELDAASGTPGEFHAAVQLRAAEREVLARSAWVAWTGQSGDDW